MIYPPLDLTMKLPDISVTDDGGKHFSLHELFGDNAPSDLAILVPGFLQCHGTCPLQVENFQKILRESQDTSTRMIFLTFASEDHTEDLARFREKHEMSPQWKMIQASPEDTLKLLDALRFVFTKRDYGYDHPSQTFAFSRDMTWIGSFYGTDITSAEVLSMKKSATVQLHSPQWYTAMAYIKNPDVLSVVGLSGLCLTLIFLFYVLFFRKKREREPGRLSPSHED